MLNIVFAIFISLLLSMILGGLLSFLLKLLIALFFIPLIVLFKRKTSSNIVINSGPWILTIEFITGIFFGAFTVYIGNWTYNSFGLTMDWLFPAFFVIFFVYFDFVKIRSDNTRFNILLNNDLRSKFGVENNNEDLENNREDMKNHQINMRYTALFGKLTGLLINCLHLFH